MQHKILLVGPKINISNKRVYGGGVGGYTRNMKVYLKYFKFENFEIIPCFHSIRGEINLGFINGPIRLFYDLFHLLNCFLKLNIKGVHIMAQYRGAIVREFFIVLISNIFNKPVLYEIKAGSFESTYNSKNVLYKFFIKYILKKSKLILVEGKPYMSFLKNKFNKESTFFPNVIPSDDIPNIIPAKLDTGITRILFIGFAYEGKGVFELYDACEELVLKGHKIKLTIVGEIHEKFKSYITKKSFNEFLDLKGKLNHNEVLEQFKINDVYCYPSKHPGEGHNNTINEALMSQMVICSSLNGFLDTFLNEDNSFPLKKVKVKEIVLRLSEIIENKNVAIDKSIKGRDLILSQFNTDKVKLILEKEYHKLLNK